MYKIGQVIQTSALPSKGTVMSEMVVTKHKDAGWSGIPDVVVLHQTYGRTTKDLFSTMGLGLKEKFLHTDHAYTLKQRHRRT